MKSGGQRSASNGGSKKKKQLIIASVGLIILVLGGLGAYTTYVNGTVKEWNNKIYPGVTVKGIDLGGKTKEEGKAILEESFSKNIQDKKIVVKVKDRDKEYDTKYSELDPKFEIDKAVDEAFNYG
ncbi:MAG: vanomycin resistance protein VanB, partial [Clostridium baratii]|nr:vanomycin resistance protein VanB [Clostridium baratii]